MVSVRALPAGSKRLSWFPNPRAALRLVLCLIVGLLAEAADRVVHVDHPADQVVEGMVHAMGEVRSRPVHAAVFGDEAAGWVAARALRAQAMRRLGEQGIRPLLEPALAAGTMTEQDLDDLVEWMLRVLISYAAVPGADGLSDDDVRRQLALCFRPALAQLLGPSAPRSAAG